MSEAIAEPQAIVQAERTLLDMLVQIIDEGGNDENMGRLKIGEAAALLVQQFGWGALSEAAKRTRKPYKTVAERARIVRYYQDLSAGQNLSVGDSVARDLLAEFSTLDWTHLRVAKGVDKDNPMLALDQLRQAVSEGMSVQEFKRHIGRLRRRNGHKPTRYVMPSKAGWTTIIKRTESDG